MSNNKVIVMVSDLDDGVHGEINVLEGPDQAARFVETLIESGFEQERIRVFVGDEMQMEVHHRPVVSLNPGTKRARQEDAPQGEDSEAEDDEEVEEETIAAAQVKSSRRIEEVNAEPMIKNGVRFSSMFRPA